MFTRRLLASPSVCSTTYRSLRTSTTPNTPGVWNHPLLRTGPRRNNKDHVVWFPQQQCQQQRFIKTSKQHRRSKKKKSKRGSGLWRHLESTNQTEQLPNTTESQDNSSMRQFIIMVGILPILMTGAVVAVREDLQNDINEKWKSWGQTAKDMDHDRNHTKNNNNTTN